MHEEKGHKVYSTVCRSYYGEIHVIFLKHQADILIIQFAVVC